jgi:radical SAM protein (TIGR04043 family)
MDPTASLERKTELLCKGVYLKPDLMDYYEDQGLSFGRKGGAGPLGGRYFTLEDKETIVNVGLWDNEKQTDLILGKKENESFKILKRDKGEKFANLRLVENPQYYNPQYKTSDGIEMRKVALVHGTDCLSTTIYQECKHWGCGEACQFCGIELSLKYDTTILEKSAEQISEVIAQAKKEGRCEHMTLTTGTYEREEKGVNKYIEVLSGIKSKYPDLPLHIQIEPMKDLKNINRLKNAGADTIGIHLETLDEELREKVTPGKAKIPRKLFDKNWEYSVDVFGKNQVETFLLVGFEDPPRISLSQIEDVVSMGVIPFITPVRAIPGKTYRFAGANYEYFLDLYIETAKMMKSYNINPLKNKAGCVRCGDCSAINEAYKAL